jgi:hypothetical protein
MGNRLPLPRELAVPHLAVVAAIENSAGETGDARVTPESPRLFANSLTGLKVISLNSCPHSDCQR